MRMNKRMTALVLVVALLMALIGALPTTAGAATGMATIDVSSLGATNVNNSAAVATESQWAYYASNNWLRLNTAGGYYTLTGTNANLGFGLENSAITVVLDTVSLALASWSTAEIPLDATVTLRGDNSLENEGTHYALWVRANSDVSIQGDGSLQVKTVAGAAAALQVGLGSSLSILDSASITAEANIPVDSSANITMSDGASLTMVNTGTTACTNTFEAVTPASATWKLTGSATTSDPLTATSITVTIPAGSTGTVSREPIPVAPTITSPNTLSVVAGTGGSLPLTATGTTPITWSLTGAPAGASITGSTLTVAATVPAGTYSFSINATNGVEPDATQSFTLTVTKAGGGNGGNNGGGDGKVPPMGDALSLLAPLALLFGSAVCSFVVADQRKRH